MENHITKRELQISSSGNCVIHRLVLLLTVKGPYASKHPQVSMGM